mmetsp:Transcript_3917/g.7403  ORF Transcript_3917/g.7403 Transcript_3917/m.7403 type:complete len:257 (-) Transcript_3917:528-1298(-)
MPRVDRTVTEVSASATVVSRAIDGVGLVDPRPQQRVCPESVVAKGVVILERDKLAKRLLGRVRCLEKRKFIASLVGPRSGSSGGYKRLHGTFVRGIHALTLLGLCNNGRPSLYLICSICHRITDRGDGRWVPTIFIVLHTFSNGVGKAHHEVGKGECVRRKISAEVEKVLYLRATISSLSHFPQFFTGTLEVGSTFFSNRPFYNFEVLEEIELGINGGGGCKGAIERRGIFLSEPARQTPRIRTTKSNPLLVSCTD